MIHISKKGKAQKRKKRKKFVSVSGIEGPDVGVHGDRPDGPVIEIPPIDDFKLASAIMNCQNNNVEDSERGDNLGERLPADGRDGGTDGGVSTAGTTANTGAAGLGNSGAGDEDDIYHDDTLCDNDDVKNSQTNNTSKQLDKHNVGLRGRTLSSHIVSGSTKTEDVAAGGSFLDQLAARVQGIVDTGEQMETEENKKLHKENKLCVEKEHREKDSNTRGVDHSAIYEGALEEDQKDIQESDSNVTKQDVEELSIYSRALDSDSNDEDFSFQAHSFDNKEPSRNSMDSNSDRHSSLSVSSRSETDLNTFGNSRPSSKPALISPSPNSSPQSIQSNTLHPTSANEKRQSSVVSFSLTNENADDNSKLTNQKSSSRPISRVSTNESQGFRTTPDVQSEASSQKSTTPVSDLEGAFSSFGYINCFLKQFLVGMQKVTVFIYRLTNAIYR